YQIMIHRDFDMWVIYGYDIREYYKQITDIDMFHDWVNNLCEVLLQNIRQKKKSVDVNIKDTLTKLIEEHLEHDISLDFLSDQLSLRPDVVSRMFKQVMGEGYTEYIKKKKLNRALELIGEDYSMKEIAQKLGYNSTQYFIKIFKETYGITPYQYKKKQELERINE
ncbi:MAG: AraC family transcriptional regulator, partial [Hungatella sp.]